MATFYQQMRDMAASLILQFGKTGVVVNRYSRISIPATGEVQMVLQQTATCSAVRNTSKKSMYQSSSSAKYDREYLVPASSLAWEPAVLDEMVVDGSTWVIRELEPISPGGTDVIYDIFVEAASETTIFVAGYGYSYGFLYGGVNV